MRIKIIGDNNCARATRHLLRLAGFAVTEYLPVNAVTNAPHAGYAITIDLAPAPHNPDPSGKSPEVHPASTPEQAAHGQPATTQGEAASSHGGASSRLFVDSPVAVHDSKGVGSDGESSTWMEQGKQAEARSTGGTVETEAGAVEGEARAAVDGIASHIHFDSVDSPLEAAVLRHVTQLATGAVIVDRPGGVVHSERELRIVVPRTGIEKEDEAAAVAVEFGVLRGLLDLTSSRAKPTLFSEDFGKSATGVGAPDASADAAATGRTGILACPVCAQGGQDQKRTGGPSRGLGVKNACPTGADPSSRNASARKKKWWTFGVALISSLAITAVAALVPVTSVHAAPLPAAIAATRVIDARGADGAYLHLEAALAAPAQGQFATGQLNLALIGGSAVSSSLYDSGNTALKVNCVVGCGTPTNFSDNSTFTAGTTAVTNLSALFNDSLTALTSGNAGALRSTTDRMLYVNIGKLGGTALSGANVVDSGNIAFRVNCVVGCSASSGFTDNSAFTAGSTAESNVGGVYNDGLSALSSGNAAAARITSARGLHINLRNSSGTEIGTSSNPVRIDPVGTTPQPVELTDGTHTVVVDPCKGQTKLYASINQTANTQITAGTASKKIYICSIHVVVASATNVALVEGTGTVCGTSTTGVGGFGGATAATGWNFAANGGIAFGNGDSSLGAEVTSADNLCVFNSGSGQVSGGISYVVQ